MRAEYGMMIQLSIVLVKHLEDWFGGPLFDRSGRRPRLLPQARDLAHALSGSFADIDAACRRARGNADRRMLVIATIPSMAICWLIPRLSSFIANHPDITVRVIYAFHGQEIDFGDVDLAFVYSRDSPERQGTEVLPFLSGASAPVCSPSLCTTAKLLDEAEGVLRAGLLHDTDTAAWTEWFQLAGRRPPEKPSGPVFEDFNLLRAATLSGQGVALCPLALIGDDLSDGRLVQLSNLTVNEHSDYYLVVRNTNDATTANASKAFTRWLFDLRDRGRHGRDSGISVAESPNDSDATPSPRERSRADRIDASERIPDKAPMTP